MYRWEDSGAVGGLVRVRGMCMNDAHIYCTAQQVKDEFKAVMAMYADAYRILGLESVLGAAVARGFQRPERARRSTSTTRKRGRDSERILAEVLQELGINYVDGPGEAAFYGPKIDIQFDVRDGRDETRQHGATRLRAAGAYGADVRRSGRREHMPFCIHRAPFSTHERMVAFLLEHFGGAFPTWLAPVQVQVIRSVGAELSDAERDRST